MKLEIFLLKNFRNFFAILSIIAFIKICINLNKFYIKKEKKIFRYKSFMIKI
jgi:hypothetical protein